MSLNINDESSLNSLVLSGSHPWFAIRVKSNRERVTALHLAQRGYRHFLPTYTTVRLWYDRVKNVEKPLFPGYVFSAFDSNARLPILTTPGVVHIVSVGKEPVPVDPDELEAIRTTLLSGVQVSPCPFIRAGERIVVERGPLAGLEGIVTRFKGTYRLVVSISLLQRSVAAEIDRQFIRPIGPEHSPEIERIMTHCSARLAL